MERIFVKDCQKFWIGKERRRQNIPIWELKQRGYIYISNAYSGNWKIDVFFLITRFNRYRPMFVCPKCTGWYLCLYIPNKLMYSAQPLCRHCYHLVYSCRVLHRNRDWERWGKYEHRLHKVAEKLQNKRIRKKTKERLQKELDFCRKKLMQ